MDDIKPYCQLDGMFLLENWAQNNS